MLSLLSLYESLPGRNVYILAQPVSLGEMVPARPGQSVLIRKLLDHALVGRDRLLLFALLAVALCQVKQSRGCGLPFLVELRQDSLIGLDGLVKVLVGLL